MLKTNPYNGIVTILLSIALSLSSVKIFAGTFGIDFDSWMFLIISVVLMIVFFFLNLKKKAWYGVIGLVAVLGVTVLFVYLDTFTIRAGINKIYSFLHYRFTAEGLYMDRVSHSRDSISVLFALLSAPMLFSISWAFLRNHTTIITLLLSLVYVIPSFLDSFNHAPVGWYLIYAICVIMLVVFENMRKNDKKVRDATLAYILVPVTLVCVLIGVLNPIDEYKKNQLATQQYNVVVSKVDSVLGTNLKRFLSKMRNEYNDADTTGYLSKVMYESTITKNDLRTEGEKSSTDTKIAELTLELFEGENMYNFGPLYLRNTSMSLYDDSTWSMVDYPEYVEENMALMETKSSDYSGILTVDMDYSSRFYIPTNSGNIIGLNTANYENDFQNFKYSETEPVFFEIAQSIEINEEDGSANIVLQAGTPYYIGTQPYFIDASGFSNHLTYYSDGNHITVIPRQYPDAFFAGETYPYDATSIKAQYVVRSSKSPSAPVPNWSQEYLYAVDTYCTEVPQSTVDEILATGVLPDWYMAVYNGQIEMTDKEKVAAVMEYVGTLKPYNIDTPYPPEDGDFVAWFLSEAETGYCVHFASTAIILLRMLNVPTRYVIGYNISDWDVSKTHSDCTNAFETTVTDANGHAWCEFFSEEYGWVGFDPTNCRYVEGPRQYTPAANPVETDEFQRQLKYVDAGTDENAVKDYSDQPEENKVTDYIKGAPEILTKYGFLFLFLLIVVVIILVRIIKAIGWLIKFKRGSNNDRIRALCRYCLVLAKHSEVPIPRRIKDLTDIAMYSREGTTPEDVSNMSTYTRDYMNTVLGSLSFAKRIWAELAYIVRY